MLNTELILPSSLNKVPLPQELPPLVMTLFVRNELLSAVLEAVSKQTLLPPKIIAFVDGAKAERHEAPIKQCIEILKEFSAIIPVEIIARESNFGCDNNVFAAFNEVFSSYSAIVYLEDDDLPNPYFYERMCRLLQAYQPYPKIFSVSGYATIPKEIKELTQTDFILSRRLFGWGLGLWADRWQELGLGVHSHGYNPYGQFSKVPATIQTKHTIVNQFFLEKNRQTDWIITFTIATLNQGGVHIIPTKSLIKNIGFGHAESSTYRGAEADWVNANYDTTFCPDSLPSTLELMPELARMLTGKELIEHFTKTGGIWFDRVALSDFIRRYPKDTITTLQFFAKNLPLLVSRLRRGLIV